MGNVTGDNVPGDSLSPNNIIVVDCYAVSPDCVKFRRLFAVDTRGGDKNLPSEKVVPCSARITLYPEEMITNVQILTAEDDDEEVIHATLDCDKRITIAYQNIRRIPTAVIDNYGYWVEILDFSHNSLRDVEELATAFKLHTLILDHNLITSDSFFPWMPWLRVLWLNNNLIFHLGDFIPALSRACPNLVYLSLLGNAAASSTVMGGSELQQMKYRQYVIRYFDKLRHLDDKPVTTIERLRCQDQNRTMMDHLLSLYNDVKSVFRFNFGKNSSGFV